MKYLELVKKLQNEKINNGHIVLIKNGIFFLGIGRDAIILNRLLKLKLICMKENMCKVGFKTRSIEKYIREIKNINKDFVHLYLLQNQRLLKNIYRSKNL